MSKSGPLQTVPKAMRARFESIAALTDAFCGEHLDAEYGKLARSMAAALCRKRPSPLGSGEPRSWACGIVYVLGQVNFLTDKSMRPHMTTADLCKAFGVGQSTAFAKAKVITAALDITRLDPAWMRAELLDRNPLVWMAEVNGFLVDLRDAPLEMQEIAFAKGLIPYIPEARTADSRKEPKREQPEEHREQLPPDELPLFTAATR